MRNLITEGIATLLSIFIATLLLICISSVTGTTIVINDILYSLIIELFQMFIPFLIYVIASDFIIKRLTKSIRATNRKLFFIQFAVYISCMIIITVVWSLGDIIISGYSKEFSYYIQEFGLFIVFSPVACIINYFLTRKYLYKYQSQ